MTEPILRMVGITKRFDDVLAIDHVDFDLRSGEIHALLGENGAGKSTLASLLYGHYKLDSGQIFLAGAPVRLRSPRDAIRLGIGMVHQHFMLVRGLSVVENLLLGTRGPRWPLLEKREACLKIQELSESLGVNLSPHRLVEDLSVGEQQRVEILRALLRGARILILDEPTALLPPQEARDLFRVLVGLKGSKHSILLITHRLSEVLAWTDRITLLRRGSRVATLESDSTTESELAHLMIGDRCVEKPFTRGSPRTGPPLLQVKDLTVREPSGRMSLNAITFSMRPGEILGVAGVEGSGQRELTECLDGRQKPSSGSILLKGLSVAGWSTRRLSEMGLALVPQDRQQEGVIGEFTLGRNAALKRFFHPPFSSGGLLRETAMNEEANEFIRVYDIQSPGPLAKGSHLSGGNLQKLILARELASEPEVLVAHHPTRGLDVASRSFVWQRLIEARNKGKAILLVSADLDEILALADRILVLSAGRMAGELTPCEATPEALGLLMGRGEG